MEKAATTRSNDKQCGIDEAGRGPVLGPMVISLVCADTSVLRDIGVKDSKMLSRISRERLYDIIISRSNVVKYVEIGPEILNTLMEKKTLNEIELQFAGELLKDATCETYVDCFDVNEERGTAKLSSYSSFPVKCLHSADRKIPAVSAASIISKVVRDRRIDSLKNEYGEIGSGYPSDPVTVKFLRDSFREGRDLSKIARVRWITYIKMEREMKQQRL
ncbi:MAG: ribonuclease HII [Candidatus Thermoplasmatota archaeon]|nr:ribonuclease HII [Candidatus Thermoplasmatota archaeon]MCL5665782.1 ribonuclease HII [Candidatus Thermoplasmatota archaeon]